MPSALRGIPNSILFYVGPRLTEPGLKWAYSTLLFNNGNYVAIKTSTGDAARGSLTAKDGLSVSLPGFEIALPRRPKGFPLDVRKITRLDEQKMTWMRDDACSWYMISRSHPVEQDIFTTGDTLAAALEKGCDLWIFHINPEFPPTDNKRQSFQGLMIEVVHGEITVTKSLSRSHVKFSIL